MAELAVGRLREEEGGVRAASGPLLGTLLAQLPDGLFWEESTA